MTKKPSEPDASASAMPAEDLQKVKPQDLGHLLATLTDESRDLTQRDQEILQGVVMSAAERAPQMVQQIIKQEFYSGSLPHPNIMNGYDPATQAAIVKMAVDEQAHVHHMHKRGLEGAILKDRLGQILGAVVALGGLGAAAMIAPHSAAAAAIIGSLDLLAIVAAFVAPRAFEKMIELRAAKAQAKPQARSPGRPRKKTR